MHNNKENLKRQWSSIEYLKVKDGNRVYRHSPINQTVITKHMLLVLIDQTQRMHRKEWAVYLEWETQGQVTFPTSISLTYDYFKNEVL